MNSDQQKTKILSSLWWSFLQRTGVQGIQLVITLLLARLLLPEDFGLIVIVTVLNTFAIVIVQSGFTTALIQKKYIDQLDLSSVFYLNIVCSVLAVLVLYLAAPVVAEFFEQPQLTAIIRILSWSLFFSAYHSIQYVLVSRDMRFKELFTTSFIAHAVAGLFGLGLAFSGFGVMALVAQQLASYVLNPVILVMYVKWRPSLAFSFTRIRQLFSFGWKLLASSFIHTIYTNMYSIAIGKLYSASMIGFYNRGEQFPSIIVSNVNGAIQSVMLPALSSYQDDVVRVQQMVRRTIVTSSFIVFPLMVGLVVIAEPLLVFILTEKWLPAVPFLQIFCIIYACWPMQTANVQAINALGRSDIFLKLEILNTLIGVVILLVTWQFGIFAMVFGLVISSIVTTMINAYPNRYLLQYGFFAQCKDVWPSLVLALLMGACIMPIHLLHMSHFATLCCQIVLGAFIYIGLAKLFKLECFTYLFTALLTMLRSSRSRPVPIEPKME